MSYSSSPKLYFTTKWLNWFQVYDQTEFSCVLRANITDEEWLAPLAGGANGSDVALVSLFSSEYQSTHEIVAHFQVGRADKLSVF